MGLLAFFVYFLPIFLVRSVRFEIFFDPPLSRNNYGFCVEQSWIIKSPEKTPESCKIEWTVGEGLKKKVKKQKEKQKKKRQKKTLKNWRMYCVHPTLPSLCRRDKNIFSNIFASLCMCVRVNGSVFV